jgi:hypothetical protein
MPDVHVQTKEEDLTMKTRTITALALGFVLVLSASLIDSAFADDNRKSQKLLMFTAGNLAVNIVQLQINNPFDPKDDSLEPISIIDEKSFGTFGRADVKTFSKVTGEVPERDQCPDGFPIPLVITDDAVVLTYGDLSQLVGNGRTVVCIEPGGTQAVRGEGQWSGGTRRFADVIGGDFRTSATATPQSTNGQFYSTVGTMSGRIERQ